MCYGVNMAYSITSRRHFRLFNVDLLSHFYLGILIELFLCCQSVYAWDNTDLELFDLVEEVKQNFYDVLGLDKSASQGDIRRAYRRLSLQYHPDKNKEEDAEEIFRKLVAVSEVLRDEDTRRRYDDILINGLPDWRQPVYYYRRVRKMGLLEATTLIAIILTVGHYIVIWSMYWEKKFELESLIKPKREKKHKKNAKLSEEQKFDPYSILEDQSFLPRPKLTDSLPCKCFRLSLASVTFIATEVKTFVFKLGEKLSRKPDEPSENTDDTIDDEKEVERKPRDKQKINPAFYEYNRDVSVEHLTAMMDTANRTEKVNLGYENKKNTRSTVWTPEEIKSLIKSIAKIPGGTPDRWDKIAAEVGRPAIEVTKKAKEIKTKGYVTSVDASVQGITGGVGHSVMNKHTGRIDTDTISVASNHVEDQPITCSVASYDYFDDEDIGKKKKRHKASKASKSNNRTTLIGSTTEEESSEVNTTSPLPGGELVLDDGVELCDWTQREQKILEKALQVYPKGTPERWDNIASSLPNKNKEECIARYKELVEIVRRKKQSSGK